MSETERWLSVPGFEGHYDVSDQGRVRSWFGLAPGSHILKSWTSGVGHPRVSLWLDGQRFNQRVHALVMLAFVGPCPAGLEIRHLNGNATDNHLSNLTYGTKSENELDRVRHGTHHNARKTHCLRGHPFDTANTQMDHGRRRCKACLRDQRAARKAAAT